MSSYSQITGLQNNLNRWYDPVVGRWISVDPIGFDALDANLFRYVGNRVTAFVDPSGLAAPGFWSLYGEYFLPRNNPPANDWIDHTLHVGKYVGWTMAIVGTTGAAGLKVAASLGSRWAFQVAMTRVPTLGLSNLVSSSPALTQVAKWFFHVAYPLHTRSTLVFVGSTIVGFIWGWFDNSPEHALFPAGGAAGTYTFINVFGIPGPATRALMGLPFQWYGIRGVGWFGMHALAGLTVGFMGGHAARDLWDSRGD